MLLVAIAALVPAYVGIVFQWRQIEDLKRGSNDSDKHLKLLAEQVKQQRDLEIQPRLMAEASRNRIKLTVPVLNEEFKRNPLAPVTQSDGVKRMAFVPNTDDFIRVRNVGRGPAYNVIATTIFDRTVTKTREISKANYLDEHTRKNPPICLKMIPSGEAVSFDHFHYQMDLQEDVQCLIGNFGLYCIDEDGNELTYVQKFRYTVNFVDDAPYALMEIDSPRLGDRTKSNPQTKRSVEYVADYFRRILKKEAEKQAEQK